MGGKCQLCSVHTQQINCVRWLYVVVVYHYQLLVARHSTIHQHVNYAHSRRVHTDCSFSWHEMNCWLLWTLPSVWGTACDDDRRQHPTSTSGSISHLYTVWVMLMVTYLLHDLTIGVCARVHAAAQSRFRSSFHRYTRTVHYYLVLFIFLFIP